MFQIFDAHCHIYPADIAARAVSGVDTFYDGLPVEPRDGTVDTLIGTGRAAGISRFLVHSVATTPHQVDSINRFLAREVENSGGAFVGFGALHPDSADQEADLRNLVALGLRGVKLHPDIQRFPADDRRAMAIYELCADIGLPVLMHTGDRRFDYSNPNRVANVLRAFPKLKLIGAHLGGWSVWDEAARILPDFPNFIVDSSSCSRWLEPDRMKRIIRAYGAERVLFGTDYPMWRQEEEIDALLELGLTDGEYQRIFWHNAEALFAAPKSFPPEEGLWSTRPRIGGHGDKNMVREIQKTELPDLLALYTHLHEKGVPEMSEHLDLTWKEILQDANHHIIVNIVDGKLVSSCVCVIIPNLTRGVRPYAIIENVVTHPDYRGMGHATACLDYAKAIAEKEHCYKMMLLTGSHEASTLRFYEHAGYNGTEKTAFIQRLE